MKKDNKGFSLIELIIVIAIMAVLVVVLAPQFTKYLERSRKSTDVQNVAEIITALQVYAADPMATEKFTINGATIEITTTEADVVDACKGDDEKAAEAALTDAGIKTVSLSSSTWASGGVKIEVKLDANGTVVVEDKTSYADTSYSILKGKY